MILSVGSISLYQRFNSIILLHQYGIVKDFLRERRIFVILTNGETLICANFQVKGKAMQKGKEIFALQHNSPKFTRTV
jgi:hypothetical protein